MYQLLRIGPLLGLLTCASATAQSLAGITGTRDTSYSVISEYNKHRKNYPGIQIVPEFPDPFVKEERNSPYCGTKERELKLDVFYPAEKTTTRRTAILFIHGGGWRSGNKAMHFPLLQRLAALGYVCFTPEYRLSTEALYPAAIYDIKSAIRWIRKNAAKYQVDPGRIVAAGHSAGGELAAFMGATNGMASFEGTGCYPEISSKVNAVIDLDGTLAFIHPESGEGDDSKKTSAATYWFGYSKTENPELWKQAAPLTHAGKHCPPFQFISSGVARMHAGRDDFNRILQQHRIYHEVKTLEGSPHTFLLFNPWFDTTIVYMDKFLRTVFPPLQKTKGRRIRVAQDGTGDFTSVQAAINAVPGPNTKPVTIFIRKGIYREKIFIDSTKRFLTLQGEDALHTILSWNDHTGKISPAGDTINTRTSWSCKIKADDFTARDISFRNDAGFIAGQAVAAEPCGDRMVFTHCRFTGNQDVLFTSNEKSQIYFEHCYIEGTTDFIFGPATAWFQQCRIYSKKNSHVTAASTPKEKEFGYVFNYCRLEGDTALHNVTLGRPWRPYAAVTYLNSYIGPHIKAEGWGNWNNTDNYKTTRYSEYKNYGPSSDPAKRVNWARQLSAAEAGRYTVQEVLNGWNPVK